MGIPISAPQAPPDPVAEACDAILTTKKPREFVAHVQALASRDHYADAADRLQAAATDHMPTRHVYMREHIRSSKAGPNENITQESLCRALFIGGEFAGFRVARACRVTGYGNDQLERFVLAKLISDPSRKARVASACLGYINGFKWDERWPLPSNRRERAGLALNLLVREMFP